ncbi:MAG: dihydroorotase [Deltaproteobacteria bacterium]|nr:dihydroorotase [Deltaproteobacteria bacterium]
MRTRLTNCEVVDPGTGERYWGWVEWEGGVIRGVGRTVPGLGDPSGDGGAEAIDGRGHLLAPSFVDLYADFCEPGFEYREDVASGSAAAAAGGYTAVSVRPDTEPACDGEDTARFVMEAGRKAGRVEVLPIGAITRKLAGEAMADIGEMAAAGVRAVGEADRWVARTGLLRHGLEYAGNFGLTAFLTGEDPALVEGTAHEGLVSTVRGLKASPVAAEEVAVARHVALAELTRTPVHLLKLTSAAGVRILREARARGVPVTASAAALHLVLDENAVAGYDPMTKVWPPLRSAEDRKALVEAVADGAIDAVVSDHCPRGIEDKELEFDLAVPGASTIETTFALLNRLVLAGELPLTAALRALAVGPRGVLGLPGGSIAPGRPADLVLLDRAVEWEVTPAALASRGKNTPFLGKTLVGRPVMTIRGGEATFDRLRAAR